MRSFPSLWDLPRNPKKVAVLYVKLNVLCQVTHMTVRTLDAFLKDLQSHGRYSFTFAEVEKNLNKSKPALWGALRRLKEKGEIQKVHGDFFIIIPPEYSALGSLPPTQFIPDLMAHMKTKYYVGLLSAAEFHAAAHQRPQQFQIIADKQIPPIHCGKVNIRIFKNEQIEKVPTVLKKTTGTPLRVSTPEATAIDLMMYPKGSGGISHIATVLTELSESIDPRLLADLAKSYAPIRVIQRLGYLLDTVGAEKIANPLKKLVDEQKDSVRLVSLVPGVLRKGSVTDSRWKIRVNEEIESDI